MVFFQRCLDLPRVSVPRNYTRNRPHRSAFDTSIPRHRESNWHWSRRGCARETSGFIHTYMRTDRNMQVPWCRERGA